MDPPLYYRKTDQESSTAKALREAHSTQFQMKQASMEAFASFLTKILEDPSKRGLEPWIGSVHEEQILALKEFAIGAGPNLGVRNMAVNCLRAANLGLTPNAAATLMEELHIIPYYAPLPLLRAGIPVAFPETVLEEAAVGALFNTKCKRLYEIFSTLYLIYAPSDILWFSDSTVFVGSH